MRVKVKLPLFGSSIILFVGEDEKERYIAECKRVVGAEMDLESFQGTGGRCCGSYLWVSKPDIGILAHELHHFASECTAHLGIEDNNGEAEAYIIGWAMKTLWPKIQERKADGPS